MRIKKIELIGFKSFKDRTVVQFDAGITGIVGPNGCGKSNIVDALVWVMGEMSAKDLRGSQMTDVIFAGAEGYAPVGMAEVSLVLENDGGPFPVKYLSHTEIMVTRRLHRSGESEYFINKEPARLRDIQEIFMDTGAGSKGFSIIQQGMIGKIITAKPEDRRSLIEEAAGITKFKARKRESIRKLESTDQNLIRLADIIGELKRQIDSLQRQAQKAERYRGVKTEIESLDLWLLSKQYLELKTSAEEAQAIFQGAQNFEVESESRMAELQAEFETLKLQMLEQEKEIDLLQSQIGDGQVALQRKELDLQQVKFDIEHAKRQEVMSGSLLSEQQARLELLTSDQTELLDSQKSVNAEVVELENSSSEHQQKFSELQSNVLVWEDRLTVRRRELLTVAQSAATLEAKLQTLDQQKNQSLERAEATQVQLEEMREKFLEFENRKKKIVSSVESEKQMQLDLMNDFQVFEYNRKSLNEQIAEKKAQVDEFKDQFNQAASRLYGLENLHANFEGFEEGVKQVMLWQKAKQMEITADGSVQFSPVSEVVEVPQEYELAMEAALGSRLQTLLSNKSEPVLSAIDHLKEMKKGRSSFYMGQASANAEVYAELPSGEGVKVLLKDIVRTSETHQDHVNQILGRVCVVDSVRTALRLRPIYPDWTFVTQDGDVLGADGVLTGGASEQADSGVLKRRREMRELTESKLEWSSKLALASSSLKKLEAQLQTVTEDFESAQKRRVEQEIKVASLEKDLERAEYEVIQAQSAFQKQEREVIRLSDELKSIEERITELSGSLATLKVQRDEIDSDVNELTENLEKSKVGFDSLQSLVVESKSTFAAKSQELEGIEKQLSRVSEAIITLQQQLEKMSEESERNSSDLTENQLKLEQEKLHFESMMTSLEHSKSLFSMKKNEFEILQSKTQEVEKVLQAATKERTEKQLKMSEAQLKFEQAKMKETYLVDQAREKYAQDLASQFNVHLNLEVHAARDIAATEIELKELKDRLHRMGEVNLSSIAEFDETTKRYEFLTQQQNDLLEAKEQLKKVIDRINRIVSKRFRETFDLVNDRFKKVFPVLFGGGEAHLELIEDVEKGEMGIDIIAKPPGKKMQNISLLSGGEKALTAVSLVFSIFLVKPSPYCLLDEVDAPLDDANVFRFNELVREMSRRSQIIVVTHNKHTMEVAKKLYGVTMQEKGVSTMVSVNLQDLA